MRYILFLSVLFFAACDGKDPVQPTGVDFTTTFKATYGGEQLETDKNYTFGSMPVLFTRYRLYVSDITLFKANGEEVVLSEVEYLDFSSDSRSSSLTLTPKYTFKNIPEGNYDGIRIGYGVKSSLNAKKPAEYASTHPLYVETDYWPGWKSYIFSVLDGKADPENDGSSNLNFSYHCGSDAVYKSFTFTQPISVAGGQSGLNISIDVKKLLSNADGSLYDIVAKPTTSHGAGNIAIGEEIMSHYQKATTIEQP